MKYLYIISIIVLLFSCKREDSYEAYSDKADIKGYIKLMKSLNYPANETAQVKVIISGMEENSEFKSQTITAPGFFILKDVPYGEYQLLIESEDYYMGTNTGNYFVTVFGNETHDLDVTLRKRISDYVVIDSAYYTMEHAYLDSVYFRSMLTGGVTVSGKIIRGDTIPHQSRLWYKTGEGDDLQVQYFFGINDISNDTTFSVGLSPVDLEDGNLRLFINEGFGYPFMQNGKVVSAGPMIDVPTPDTIDVNLYF